MTDSPAQWLLHHAAKRPDHPALTDENGTLDYRSALSLACTLAADLRQAGIRPGGLAALTIESPRLIAGLVHGALLSGCALMPLSPDLPPNVRAELTASAGAISAPSEAFGRGTKGHLPPTRPIAPKDIALVVATSGTSGRPRGVMLTARNLALSTAASRRRLGLGPNDTWLCCLPLHSIGGLSILYRCAEAGAEVLLHERFDAACVAKDLATGRVTHVSFVPAMLARILDIWDGPPPKGLKVVLVGGAALSASLAARIQAAGWPLAVTYGMTETASQAATLFPAAGNWRQGLVGPPLKGLEVGFSEGGRIRLRGGLVMAGYANPQRRPGDGLDFEGWFETADLGELDGKGNLYVHGRADDVLISGGETFHPREIEIVLAKCPGVEEVAITSRPDPVWGDYLIAVVAGKVSADGILEWSRAILKGARRPREAMIVDRLPRNAMGKLNRAAVRRLAAAN